MAPLSKSHHRINLFCTAKSRISIAFGFQNFVIFLISMVTRPPDKWINANPDKRKIIHKLHCGIEVPSRRPRPNILHDSTSYIGLNFYFVHYVIHTIVINTSVNRIWSDAHWLILTISSLSYTFVNTECLRRWGKS